MFDNKQPMNILFIGSSGVLSLTPFRRLLASTHNLAAVGIFNPLLFDRKIIIFAPISLERESLALAASQYGIPLIYLNRSMISFDNVKAFQSTLF